MDIGYIGTALTSLKTATDLAKIIKDSGNTLEQAEVNFKLAELVGALAEAKLELASIQEVLASKEKQINKLKSEMDVKSNLQWERPYYFLKDGDSKEGPFCQKCYDTDSKLIRLQERDQGSWCCHTCTGYYTDKNYNPPEIDFSNGGLY